MRGKFDRMATSVARADLHGRVAIVTGASAGIGEATARVLAGAGMRVAICARRRERLDLLAAEIGSAGGETAAYGVDVTDAGAVRAMVDDVGARWGSIDVLVNNAGRGLSATVEDTKPEESKPSAGSLPPMRKPMPWPCH